LPKKRKQSVTSGYHKRTFALSAMTREEEIEASYQLAVDAAHVFQNAVISHGSHSYQASQAHADYVRLMDDHYKIKGPVSREKHWQAYCEQNAGCVECREYDV
jgi:hypothetical protein